MTQRFEIVSTYTDRLFAGGWPTEVRTRLPLQLQMTSGTAIAVTPSRGPTLEYTVTAVVPDLAPTDLIGRGRYYPRDVARRYLELPFPLRPQDGGAEAAAEWRAAAAAAARRPRVGGPVRAERTDRGRGDGPVPRGPGRGAVPAHHLRLLPAAAVRGLRLALRGVPLRDPHRVLPALRRRHGRAPPLQRDPRPRRRRLHPRGRGAERRVGRVTQRRPLVGRGVLPGRRLGAVRPDAGTTDPQHRRRARRRPRGRRSRAGRRRGVTGAVGQRRRCRQSPGQRPGRTRRPDDADGADGEPERAAVGARDPRGPRRLAGRPRAAAPARPGPRVHGRAAARVRGAAVRRPARPRRRDARLPDARRDGERTCASAWAWTRATCRRASRRSCSEAGRRARRTSPTSADLRRRVRRRLRERAGRPAAVLALYGIRPPYARRRLARPGDRLVHRA